VTEAVQKKVLEIATGAILIGFGVFCWSKGWDATGTWAILFGIMSLI
jgi:hypothetical protein